MSSEVKLVTGNKDDYQMAVDQILKDQHWSFAYYDYDIYMAIGDGKYVIIAKDNEEKFVGCIMVATFAEHIAFLDNFFVMPEYRSRGIGRILFTAALKQASKDDYNVGLYSELHLSDFYKAQGFIKISDHRIHVFYISNIRQKAIKEHSLSILEKPTVSETEEICDYDRKACHRPRKGFISQWLLREDARVLAIQTGTGVTVGYGVLRRATRPKMYIFGPLYADSEATLEPLLAEFLNCLDSEAVIEIRVPSLNMDKLCALVVTQAEISPQSVFIPQFTKQLPDIDYQYVYGITDFSASV